MQCPIMFYRFMLLSVHYDINYFYRSTIKIDCIYLFRLIKTNNNIEHTLKWQISYRSV